MAERGRAMRSGLVGFFLNDLKQPWSTWNKVSVTFSMSWIAWMSYALSRTTISSRKFEVVSSVGPGLFWITVGAGIVALAKKGSGKIVALFLLIVSTALGSPILVLTLIWIPILVLHWLSLLRFAFASVGDVYRIVPLLWIIVALVGSFLFLLLRRVRKA